MQYINLDSWKRKEHFDYFQGMEYPLFNISANLDVTQLRRFVKAHRISFYYAMIYVVTHAANQVENFRYRLRGGQIILHEQIHASFTALDEQEDDLFKFVTVEVKTDLLEFAKATAERVRQQKSYFESEATTNRDDLIYITCLPWISFTQVTHPFAYKENNTIPKISWGKYFDEGGRLLIPFSVQANHALVDGVHAGRFFNGLQSYLNSL